MGVGGQVENVGFAFHAVSAVFKNSRATVNSKEKIDMENNRKTIKYHKENLSQKNTFKLQMNS